MPKNHFKLEDSNLGDIFHSPSKLTIFIAVFVVIVSCTIVLIKIDMHNMTAPAKSAKLSDEKNLLIQSYTNEVKSAVNNFLAKRADNGFADQQAYADLINQTVGKILNLTVPVDYKEFHLKLVVLLDKESQNVNKNGSLGNGLEKEWNEFLNEYGWVIN